MFSYISGKIASKNPTQVVLDVGGIGYEINVSLHTYGDLNEMDFAKLWIHMAVREDDITLYGFSTAEERAMFRKLITVSGIGATTARLILSGLRVDEIVAGIHYEDAPLFQQVKGIGKKTAQRLILDLKDKVDDLVGAEAETVKKGAVQSNTAFDEALSALITLGYKKGHVTKVLTKLRKSGEYGDDAGLIIKEALKILS